MRMSTLRSNEKFMREVQKKHEELKRQRIEAEPRKREMPVMEARQKNESQDL